jgi:hypothetical protein
MTTEEEYYNPAHKRFQDLASDEKLQLDWIRGLLDQIEFANRPEVLPDFVLRLDVRRRKM